MGINFSRLLSLKYGNAVSNYLHTRYTVISVGRVMTCVLGMVVRREREIRQFVKTPFYRVVNLVELCRAESWRESGGQWKVPDGIVSPKLYKENGFKEKKDAEELIGMSDQSDPPLTALIEKLERKKENKNPPLLYNLAELQNDCSRMFKA